MTFAAGLHTGGVCRRAAHGEVKGGAGPHSGEVKVAPGLHTGEEAL